MGMRQRLLETPAERVPPGLAETVAEFCRPLDVVRAGYVGLTELRDGDAEPEERLAVAFVLAETDASTEEGLRQVRLVTDRFYETMPDEIQAGGCGFLEAGGLAVWEERAQRVFAR